MPIKIRLLDFLLYCNYIFLTAKSAIEITLFLCYYKKEKKYVCTSFENFFTYKIKK